MSKVKAGEAFVEIGGDPRKLFAALSKATRQIGKIGDSFASAGKRMMAIGAGVTAPILASAQAFASVGSALYDMSKRTGVAAESLSVLKFAAEQTGTDMAGVETAVKKMQQAIYAAGNGGQEAADALAMVGLSAQDLAGLSADEQMGKIADGLMAIQDPGTRAAVAMAIFGRAGTSILPMLEGGSAGMAAFAAEAQRLGLVMDGDTAAKADALGDAIDALKSAMQMAFLQIGSAVAPILTKIAQALAAGAAAVGKFITENQDLVVTALQVGAALVAGGASLYALGKGLKFTSSAFGGVLQALKLIPVALSVAFGPIGLLAAAITGVVMLGPKIRTAFGGVFDGLGAAAESVGGVFASMASDAAVVFGDLASTATTTFNGIYDAIANGDLSGAMDVLWAGLQAGWLRGVEALMGAVDPWISMFQNTFTVLGAEIYKVWDTIWVNVSNSFNTFGAYLRGAFDNVINGVMAAWDNLEAGIRKSWNYVQSFFKRGFDLEKENNKVDSEMTARARQRELERPGVEGRARKAAEENARANRELDDRRRAVDENTQATISQRDGQNAQLRDERRAATQAAEERLANLTAGQAERRAAAEAERIAKEEEAKATAAAAPKVADVTSAAAAAASSQSEVAGTFSAQAIGGMGFGQSLQQKANEILGRIEANTRQEPGLAVAP